MNGAAVDDARAGEASAHWAQRALATLAGFGLRRPTPLIRVPAADPRITILLKDESVQPTGSIKARLARRLVEQGIRDGRIAAATRLVDVSSGSTAIAEAAVARCLGLPFTAVLPQGTTLSKIAAIEREGGAICLADTLETAREQAVHLGTQPGAYYLDQFGRAGAALDSPGADGLGRELFRQARAATGGLDPTMLFLAVGTGGSLTALANGARHRGLATRICLADPEASDLHRIWAGSRASASAPILVEGIGGRSRPGFRPDLVDCVCPVADADSMAAARMLSTVLGKRVGGSTGTAFWALANSAPATKPTVPTVLASIIYDDGERYAETLYSDAWVRDRGLDLAEGLGRLRGFLGHDAHLGECQERAGDA